MKVYEIQESFGLDNVKLAERPDPKPGPGQVLVRIRAVSLNFRDLMVVKGLYNPKLRLPRIPCSDGAGEVVAVGDGVERVKTGDRVAGIFMQKWVSGRITQDKARSDLGGTIDGVLSEQVLFDQDGVVPLPSHLSFEEGATLPCAAVTAWHGLVTEGGLEAGETVLTLGSGGVSVFALQIARLAGARVIATSSSDEKLARLRELGASETINYRTTEDWDKKVLELTGKVGVDHVVEVGGAGTLPRSLKAVRPGGKIAMIGVLSGPGQADPTPILMKNVRVQGIFVGSREMFEDMNRAIGANGLKPVVDRIFSFDEAADAFRHMESGAHFGKIVIRL